MLDDCVLARASSREREGCKRLGESGRNHERRGQIPVLGACARTPHVRHEHHVRPAHQLTQLDHEHAGWHKRRLFLWCIMYIIHVLIYIQIMYNVFAYNMHFVN